MPKTVCQSVAWFKRYKTLKSVTVGRSVGSLNLRKLSYSAKTRSAFGLARNQFITALHLITFNKNARLLGSEHASCLAALAVDSVQLTPHPHLPAPRPKWRGAGAAPERRWPTSRPPARHVVTPHRNDPPEDGARWSVKCDCHRAYIGETRLPAIVGRVVARGIPSGRLRNDIVCYWIGVNT